MIDLDVRALQVRRLEPAQLAALHEREAQQGYRLMPWEISKRAGIADLKATYGVPRKPAAIRAWAKTVRQVVGRFLRERQLRVTLDDLVDLHAFDRAVAASDLDFHFETATPAKKARDDDWFSRSKGDL